MSCNQAKMLDTKDPLYTDPDSYKIHIIAKDFNVDAKFLVNVEDFNDLVILYNKYIKEKSDVYKNNYLNQLVCDALVKLGYFKLHPDPALHHVILKNSGIFYILEYSRSVPRATRGYESCYTTPSVLTNTFKNLINKLIYVLKKRNNNETNYECFKVDISDKIIKINMQNLYYYLDLKVPDYNDKFNIKIHTGGSIKTKKNTKKGTKKNTKKDTKKNTKKYHK